MGTGQQPGQGAGRGEPDRTTGRLGALLPMIADVALPVIAFVVLEALGWQPVAAYAGATAVSAAGVLLTALRRRKVDGLALFMLSVFAVQLVAALLMGDVRAGLVADSLLGAVAGVACLVSCAIGRPAFHTIALRIAGQSEKNRSLMLHRWETLPGYRRMMRTITLVCGSALLVEAVVRLVLITFVPAEVMVGLSRVLQFGTLGGLVMWAFWYARRTAPRWNVAATGPAHVAQHEFRGR
jgi:hypothetical protein